MHRGIGWYCSGVVREVAKITAAITIFQISFYKIVSKCHKHFIIYCRLPQFQIPNILPVVLETQLNYTHLCKFNTSDFYASLFCT